MAFHFNKIIILGNNDISQLIYTIGKAVITYDCSLDIYLYNGKIPGNFSGTYHSELYDIVNNSLLVLINREFSIATLKKYIACAEVEKESLQKIKKKATENFEVSKDSLGFAKAENCAKQFGYILEILEMQKGTIDRIISQLNGNLENLLLMADNEISNDESAIELNSSNKAVFNMSKKESLMFIYLLEAHNILKFENNSQRNIFIEKNFIYTDQRNISNDEKLFPMKDVKSEFSKIKSLDKAEVKTNNKNLDSLISKLESLMEHKF